MSIGLESRNQYAAIIRTVNNAGALIEPDHLDIRPTLVAIVYPDNQQVIPQQTDNWSRLAWQKLGDGRRWWIIADASQVIDPFLDLSPQQQTNAITQLAVNVPAGHITQITVKSTTPLSRGMTLFVEDLNPANRVNFTTTVLDYNATTRVVNIQGVTAPAIPFALSRISQIVTQGVSLVCPSVQRAFFEFQQFSNPLNVLIT